MEDPPEELAKEELDNLLKEKSHLAHPLSETLEAPLARTTNPLDLTENPSKLTSTDPEEPKPLPKNPKMENGSSCKTGLLVH